MFQVYYPDDREQRDRTWLRAHLAGIHVFYFPVSCSKSRLISVPYLLSSYDDSRVEGQNCTHMFDLQEGM